MLGIEHNFADLRQRNQFPKHLQHTKRSISLHRPWPCWAYDVTEVSL